MIDSMMNFGVSCGDLTSPQFIKNTEDKRPFTQNSLNSPKLISFSKIIYISKTSPAVLIKNR